MPRLRFLASVVVAALVAALLLVRAGVAQRAPAWWDPDGVSVGADWHYRVPVTLPAGASAHSTAKVDIDFAALMVQLGISGTFDPNSVRVVRPGGSIATTQEFTDTIYAGATDPAGNNRGEVRWIIEDGGAQTYYVYFDITQNGAKGANPQVPINGNFEQSAAGTQLPIGWTSATKSNASYDMEVRPSESVSVTSDGGPANNPYTTDGSPQSGSYSYLLGARTNNEPAAGGGQQSNTTVLTRTFVVPASNPGSFTVNWRVEGWDSEGFDNLYVTISSGSTTTTVVGNALASYTTVPNSPNIGSGQATGTTAGYGQYNGYDMTTGGAHQNGMSVALHSERWWTRSVPLDAFAGQTVTLTIGTNNIEAYKSWFHIDNVEWSVVNGTLGNAEGFGVALTAPLGSLAPGQAVRITARVDAKPTGAGSPVLADVFYPGGALFAGGVVLYDDGAHGDGAAGDGVFASAPITIPLNSGSGTGWLVRVTAHDASTSTQGQAGLIHRNGQPTIVALANWWNIDEASFSVDAANIGVTKSMTIVSDGVNLTNFKAIPGATLRYCVTIGNTGTATATAVTATDSLPAGLTYVLGSMLSGSDCTSAATVEDDDAVGADESDPVGASYAGGTITINRGTLPTSTSFALTYRVTVN